MFSVSSLPLSLLLSVRPFLPVVMENGPEDKGSGGQGGLIVTTREEGAQDQSSVIHTEEDLGEHSGETLENG